MDDKTRTNIAYMIVGLYMVVVLALLTMAAIPKNGVDFPLFFQYLNQANFLLGPVGFVMGYYFKGSKVDEHNDEQG